MTGQGGLVGNGNDGFGATSVMVTSLDGGITPLNFLRNPFPSGFAQPSGSSLGLNSQLGQAISPWNSDFPAAMTQQFNLGLQRQFRGFLVEAALVGSRSTKLPMLAPIDQLQPQYLSQGSSLLTQVPNPFYRLITTGPLSSQTIAKQRLMVPYQHFASVSLYTPIGQATYDALQVRAERRFARGISLLLAYTFGKSLTDVGGGAWYGFNQPTIQNYYDLRSEKAISPIDIANRVVVSFQYELPFGKGKSILRSSNRIVQALAGGWHVNSVGVMQTGLPLSLVTAVNQINALAGTSRPNIAPGRRRTSRRDKASACGSTLRSFHSRRLSRSGTSRARCRARGDRGARISTFRSSRTRPSARR
jgi:hypothetical protein